MDRDQFFRDNYNTVLPPNDERQYQDWVLSESKRQGRDVSLDTNDYDLRGAWRELNSGQMTRAENGHLGDKYKKPNHPTFSDQSVYNGVQSPWGVPYQGGSWSEDGKSYTPSQTMLRYTHDPNDLKTYMQKREPGVKLNMDGAK